MPGITFSPSSDDGVHFRWDLPAHGWSGAEFEDETIRIQYAEGEWWGFTEANQCVRRDLEPDEVASVFAEFKLTTPRGAQPPVQDADVAPGLRR